MEYNKRRDKLEKKLEVGEVGRRRRREGGGGKSTFTERQKKAKHPIFWGKWR